MIKILLPVLGMLLLLLPGLSSAQLNPISCEIGLGGGITLPTGSLEELDNSGWNAGAKARFSSILPLEIVAEGNYCRQTLKVGSESGIIYSGGAGLEYKMAAPFLTPYLAVQGLVSGITSTAANAATVTREGLGIGGGTLADVPNLGRLDLSVQYRMYNLIGKQNDEPTFTMVVGTVYLVFPVF